MQIHELTKRKLNELAPTGYGKTTMNVPTAVPTVTKSPVTIPVSKSVAPAAVPAAAAADKNKGGFVRGLGAVAGGIGSSLVNKLATAQGLNPVFGGQKQATSAGAQSAAAAANSPLIKGMVTAGQKEFKQDVADMMQTMRDNNGQALTKVSQIPPAKLTDILNKMSTKLIGQPIDTVIAKIDPAAYDGKGAEYGAKLKASLEQVIPAIVAQEQADPADAAKESALWTTWSQIISGAKSTAEFASQGFARQAAATATSTTGAPAQALSPIQTKLANQMGIDAQQVADIKALIAQSGGALTPDLKALFGVTK